MASADEIMRIDFDLAGEVAGQEPRLDLEEAAHGDSVAEDGMRRLLIEPTFVGGDKGTPRVRLQVDCGPCGDEAVGLYLAVVDDLHDGGIGEDGAIGFHHVEGERRAAEAGAMVEAEIGVETDG